MFEQFTVIPAIDLKAGQVVRLLHGDMKRATIYGADPAAVSRRFEDQGAALIHIVDLDGAIAGTPRNLEAIAKIRGAVRCALDVSGGLRTIESIRDAVVSGADYVSIGSAAFLNPELVRNACIEFPRRIFGSLDVRDGMLAIKGWVETSKLSVTDAARLFRDAGVAAAIVTDIARDGAQSGVDAARMAATASIAAMPIVASGGVSTLDDVVALRKLFDDGVVGVIVGRALYEGNFTLEAGAAFVAIGWLRRHILFHACTSESAAFKKSQIVIAPEVGTLCAFRQGLLDSLETGRIRVPPSTNRRDFSSPRRKVKPEVRRGD